MHIRSVAAPPDPTGAGRRDARSLGPVPNDVAERLTTDVVVVGGGPAGAAAAIGLARDGRSVVLVDKAVFPRDKCCGDGLTTLALRELEQLGFDPGSVTDWFDVTSAVLRSPSGREVVIPLPTTGKYAAIAPRLQLDDALLRLARKEGVDVRDGRAFRSLVELDDRVVVQAGDLEIIGRYVVAADGMWSPVRKAVGSTTPNYLGEWHGFRQYARNVTGSAAQQLYVWFEPDLLPGYAWSFPLPGGRANIGFGVLRDGTWKGKEMKALWADLLDRPHVAEALGSGAELEDRHTAWPIPARIDEIELARGRVLFTGDAAAATDVMTGEGIGQALLTGRLAAEAITAAGALAPTVARRRYEDAVRFHLVADHRMSRRLGTVLAHRWGARGRYGSSARAGGGGDATSRAGCSRTSRGRSC